jgi:hypothetical protein
MTIRDGSLIRVTARRVGYIARYVRAEFFGEPLRVRVLPGGCQLPSSPARNVMCGPTNTPTPAWRVFNSFVYSPRYTTFTGIVVAPATAGSVVRVRCSGRGCRFETKTVPIVTDAPSLDLTPLVRRARLRPGAQLEVRVSKPGGIGVIVTLTVRAGRRPLRSDLCLPADQPPDTASPVECP